MTRISTRILFLLVSLFLVVGCENGSKNRSEEFAFDGKIKEIRSNQFWIEAESGEIEKGENRWGGDENYKMVFDESGYVLETERYDLDGALRIKEIKTYDEEGVLIETKKYDYSNGGEKETWKHKKHFKKNPVKPELTEVYGVNGELKGREIRVYDENGNQIEYNYIDIENDGYRNQRFKYEYDPNGRLIKSEIIEKDEPLLLREYTYEDNEVLIKIDFDYGDVKGSYYEVMKYNDKKDLIEVELPDQGSNYFNHREYTYEYDERGNWVRRVEYVQGNPRTITEREIEYFN